MANDPSQQPVSSGLHISIDWWAVIAGLTLVILVLAGVTIPW